MLTIPFNSTRDNQTFGVTLDGKKFQLYFRFNYRDDAWFFSAKDSAGDWLIQGRRVVGQARLIPELRLETQPAGALLTIDVDGLGHAPGRHELGTGAAIQIIYLSAQDVEDLST